MKEQVGTLEDFTLKGLTPEQKKAAYECGYVAMFADRQTLDDAIKYIELVGKASGSTAHVMTACMVYVNTLVKILAKNGRITSGDRKDRRNRMIMALIDTAERTTDLGGVYNDQISPTEFFTWEDIGKEFPEFQENRGKVQIAKQYHAVNHNGIPLCKPTTKAKAQTEAEEYIYATGNSAHVEEVEGENP